MVCYLLRNLPYSIQSKIIVYYLSFGTTSANAIRNYSDKIGLTIKRKKANELNEITEEKEEKEGKTFWRLQVINNREHMIRHDRPCPYEVLCDLRIAILDSEHCDIPGKRMLTGIVNLFRLDSTTARLLKIIQEEESNNSKDK